jgi:hypothetical protein
MACESLELALHSAASLAPGLPNMVGIVACQRAPAVAVAMPGVPSAAGSRFRRPILTARLRYRLFGTSSADNAADCRARARACVRCRCRSSSRTTSCTRLRSCSRLLCAPSAARSSSAAGSSNAASACLLCSADCRASPKSEAQHSVRAICNMRPCFVMRAWLAGNATCSRCTISRLCACARALADSSFRSRKFVRAGPMPQLCRLSALT